MALSVLRLPQSVNHGLHTLQGRWPAVTAAARLVKFCRLADEMRSAHLQLGRWKGSRRTEATYTALPSSGLGDDCWVQPVAIRMMTRASCVRCFIGWFSKWTGAAFVVEGG